MPAECTHPTITADVVNEAEAKCYRYWDSSFSYLTCPDCGWQGYPEVDEDDETVIFLEEPRGAGESIPC